MAEKYGEQVVQSGREARQGEPGPSVRNVLITSTSAVIIVLAIVWFIFFRT